MTRTPWMARRWVQSATSSTLVYRATEGAGSLNLTVEGSATEQLAETNLVPMLVTTEVVGSATWDVARGVVVGAVVETRMRDPGARWSVTRARSRSCGLGSRGTRPCQPTCPA